MIPGIKSSQIPEFSRACSGCESLFQLLKLPMTVTACAFGRPHAEVGAGFAVDGSQVCAKLLVSAVMASLVEKIKILLGQCHCLRDLESQLDSS